MASYTIYDRLHKRELGDISRLSRVRGIYGDYKWVKDLDIVNELDGHSGCVNALSWSKSGRLLASGSDDQHLNIHSFQPDESTSPFKLTTTVATGHRANIFSVKFMPHSNDRTLITAAGDCEIRIFDVEYAGRALPASQSSEPAHGFLHHGIRFLSEGDTNAKVYRSHSDRVKRIVTESSPHLFLSCSEDGEVRQWDLRQPSSYYPLVQRTRFGRALQDDSNVPPPLISYRRHQLELNTISCSPSQPHYIALGGGHLHCFLHDRRMLGRDKTLERGMPTSPGTRSDHDEEQMGEATQCVRRFAPYGKQRMARGDNGHITACKISDANPNEMVVSWSGDWIYSFNLIGTPEPPPVRSIRPKRVRESRDLKRKRRGFGSMGSREGAERASSTPRLSSHEHANGDGEGLSLRVNYQNGQSESIPLESSSNSADQEVTTDETLTEAQRLSYRIASTLVKIRRHMFILGEPRARTDADPTGHKTSFNSVLGFAASILPDMNEIAKSWRYPVNPDELQVVLQNTLRQKRNFACQFVQTSGVVARLLGGQLRTGGSSTAASSSFSSVELVPAGQRIQCPAETFYYDFLKAIVLWLESGPGALVEEFSQRSPRDKEARLPIPQEHASIEAIDDYLIPYLLRLAGDKPIPDVDASRFEVDANRRVFESERAAVLAFAAAVKIPFADLSSAVVRMDEGTSSSGHPAAQDRKTALRFWGLRVARGVLSNAAAGINHEFVDRAFGGLGRPNAQVKREERSLQRRLADIDGDSEESESEAVASVGVESARRATEATESDEEMVSATDLSAAMAEARRRPPVPTVEVEGEEEDDVDYDELQEGSSDDDVGADSESNSESESESEESESEAANFIFRSAFARSTHRERVHPTVPCVSHIRSYQGHCNVKTVKDVNFYGLNDEYVVSGSDSGHVFIWDRASSKLLNILEGDGEVVNVVQGHPYEPMLAVSGIDHTIKIFSPDRQARLAARRGTAGSSAADPSSFSSLQLGGRRLRVHRSPSATPSADERADDGPSITSHPAGATGTAPSSDEEDQDDGWQAPRGRRASDPPLSPGTSPSGGLASRRRMYQHRRITAHNESSRRGGNRDAYITRSMLAQLAQRMQLRQMGIRFARRREAGDGEGEDAGAGAATEDAAAGDAALGLGLGLVEGDEGEDETLELDEECSIM